MYNEYVQYVRKEAALQTPSNTGRLYLPALALAQHSFELFPLSLQYEIERQLKSICYDLTTISLGVDYTPIFLDQYEIVTPFKFYHCISELLHSIRLLENDMIEKLAQTWVVFQRLLLYFLGNSRPEAIMTQVLSKCEA